MADGFFKLELDAPPTVNEVGSMRFNLDTKKGPTLYIEKLWFAAPEIDAIAAADSITVQISTKSQNDNAALYDIENELVIMTEKLKFHLAEAAITNLKDPSIEIELENFRGVMLPSEFYINVLIIGQTAVKPTIVLIKGNHTNKTLDSDYFNRSL